MKQLHRVLVANRGEIARRVIATCDALGIETVAVFSDADASAPFVTEATTSVRLPGSSPGDTYLRGDLVVQAARAAGADAVHPGYGFLSESAAFATQVAAAGLTWIGPPPAAIEAMGSKVNAKALMAAAGVPCLESFVVEGEPHAQPMGTGDPSAQTAGAAITVEGEPHAQPMGTGDPTDHAIRADAYPLLVKASAGGGGRGMRVVRTPDDLADALASARAEAASAFGDATVFVEQYVETGRHVEVQVMADEHGTVWVLGERDCSIQRRHQKVVEESPAPGLSDGVRAAMHTAAAEAATAIGYVGAGTVEFLLSGDRFWFLEMNTRLQVEHPVTECVTGLDLVALQLHVAEGGRLEGEVPAPQGHAIEVRLYAEDPAEDWRPQTGVVRHLAVPGTTAAFGPMGRHGIRLDSGVRDGDTVSVHYDPMLAKVIAWGPTRADAARRLAGALRRTRLHGVRTNRDLLVRVLGDEEFLAGRVHTALLPERLAAWSVPLLDDAQVRRSAVAAALAQAVAAQRSSPVQARIPTAWRSVQGDPRRRRYTVDGARFDGGLEVAYLAERGALRVVEPAGVTVLDASPTRVTLEHAGVVETYDVAAAGSEVDVDGPAGGVRLTVVPRFVDPSTQVAHGSLLAPMPGVVTAVSVAEGEPVARGQAVLVLEAMKMQHTISAPDRGVVTSIGVAPGQQVESGAVLAVVEPAPREEPA
jgi:propionyl-CoA carboxylase alpha chain